MTNEKYCKYAAYYGNLYDKINRSDPYMYNPEQNVYDKMEQMLFGMIIVAADINDTMDGLYKLEAYIVHLINEYENGNDELYIISRSYKKTLLTISGHVSAMYQLKYLLLINGI